MKIIFICGSLEPGRDGVGDYTRRLAGEFIRQGNQAAMLALNDRSINGVIKGEQEQEAINIKVLRLGANESSRDRLFYAKKWIDKLNPEWLSLQYVPFSFHKKGFPWRLAKQLTKLGTGKNWHIMFHELWVGMDKKASYKHIILGNLQKYIIKQTIKVLNPKMINTQTCLYREQLAKLGYKADLLPLFGNIPVLNQREELNEGFTNIAVFGGIHAGAKLKKMIKELPKSNKYKFHFIGSNGPEQDNWIDILKENNIDFTRYGWLKNKEVSRALSSCQWGLTSTPYYLNEKSGSAAAMLEHNLIVFCIARKWKPRNIKAKLLFNKSVIKWKSSLDFEKIIKNKGYKEDYNIEGISKKFIEGLLTNQV